MSISHKQKVACKCCEICREFALRFAVAAAGVFNNHSKVGNEIQLNKPKDRNSLTRSKVGNVIQLTFISFDMRAI